MFLLQHRSNENLDTCQMWDISRGAVLLDVVEDVQKLKLFCKFKIFGFQIYLNKLNFLYGNCKSQKMQEFQNSYSVDVDVVFVDYSTSNQDLPVASPMMN